MSSHEDFDAILKRIEDGTQTEADAAALRQLLRGEGRSEVVQQLAKYNIHMDKAEGIQIGDRYYNTPKQETAEVDFRRYVRSVIEEYQHWWEKYTLTDVLGREKRKGEGRSPSEWNFDLMVQTARRQEPQEKQEEEQQKEKIERFPVLEGLQKYAKDHVLLVGRPGSGKSTALVRLLLEEAQTSEVPQTSEVLKTSEVLAPASLPPQIPVLVELRFWQTSMLDRILKFLQKHDPELNLSESTVEALLKKGQLLLLVDGLNELPSEDARRDVARFRNDYRKTTPMIFTTRELSVGGDLGIEKKLEMQPLTEGQMRSFVKAYLSDRGDTLLAQLRDRLRELGQTPLLLAMLCSIFQNTEQLPNNLGEVFRQFTQFYENGLKQDVPVSDESRRWWRPLLERLAFVMMHEDSRLTSSVDFRVAIGRSEVLQEFEGWLQGRVSDPGDRAAECLEDLLEHHLIQLNGDRIEFRHQMIQEYYAAEYLLPLLLKLTDTQLKCHYLNYLKWTESFAILLKLIEDDSLSLKIVELVRQSLDLILSAKLTAKIKPLLQSIVIDRIDKSDIPLTLKCEYWAASCTEKGNSNLLELMKHQEADVRKVAIEVIGERRCDPLMEHLLSALSDESSEVRGCAAVALGKTGSRKAVNGLLLAIKDKDDDVRIKVIGALEKIGDRRAVSELRNALKDDAYLVRESAFDALKTLGDFRVEQNFSVESDEHRPKIKVIGETSSSTKCKRSIQDLLLELQSDDIALKIGAIESLGENESDLIIDLLIRLLREESFAVRLSAIRALRRLRSKKAVCELLHSLQNSEYPISWEAAYALGEIGGNLVVEGLVKVIQSNDFDIRWRAGAALARLKNSLAVEVLVHSLNNNHPDVCESIISTLGEIGSSLAIEGLLSKLKDEHSGIRWQTVIALGRIGVEAAAQGLLETLADEDPDIRRNSAISLGIIGSAIALPKLCKLQLESPTREKSQAIAAIQSRCKFYNYELYQQAQSQAEESDRTEPVHQKIYNFNGPVGNVNTGNVNIQKGDQIGLQNNHHNETL
jgi:HEAT repeat protein